METEPSHLDTTRADGSDGRIRVWRIVGQSFSVLFRHIVPFFLLAVGVGLVLGITRYLFISQEASGILAQTYNQSASIVLSALSKVPVDAVIAMAVWADLGGRRWTLKGSLVRVARAIPGIRHRPFYLFVSRVFAVAVARAALNLPYHTATLIILASGMTPRRVAVWLTARSILGIIYNTLVDSRLLVLIPVAAIERTDIRNSISRCWRLTSHHWVRTLGLVGVVACFSATMYLSAGLLLPLLVGSGEWIHIVSTWTASSWVITTFFRLFRPVVAAVCYRYIRIADGEIASD